MAADKQQMHDWRVKYMFSIIDLFCGIGGMSKGFLDAGFQVNEAIDIDKEKINIYDTIFGKNIAKCQDIFLIDPNELKDADVIAGSMLLNNFCIKKQTGIAKEHSFINYLLSLVHGKKPKAIVLEAVIWRIKIIHEACNCFAKMGYHIYYRKLAGQSYSGLPSNDAKIYIVGIRNDLYNRNFYFPKAIYNKNEIHEKDYLFERNVDPWYRKIQIIDNYIFEENKIYVRRMNQFYESDLITNGILNENFICDSEGLRRCTHIEMAQLKGLALYDYNVCKNKRMMYRYISQATNAIVISYIAKALREYLNGKETVGDTELYFPEEQLTAQSNMRPLAVAVQNKPFEPKREVNKTCPRNEWDELINSVSGKAKNNLEQGKALEKLMLKFFSEVEGFQCQPSVRTETEEIDIWILNKSKDELFLKESALILCECKNWKQNVCRNELNVFIEKMKNRSGRCKLGFFIAWNGVTSKFNEELLRFTRGQEVVVLLTKEGIINAIKTESITKYLQEEYSKALLR